VNEAPVMLDEDGIAIHSSAGDGDRVLWLHGYTLDSRIWTDMWSQLPGWHHLGVDLPGHGASRPLDPAETLPRMARSLARLAAKYEVNHVVGLSFGGMVALQLAIESSRPLASLILGSPALGGGPQDPHAQTRHVELIRLYRERGSGPWLRELWMQWPPDIFKGVAADPRLWKRLCGIVDDHGWLELENLQMGNLVSYPQRAAQLRQISAATLVLVGEHDMLAFKRSAELIRRAIPRCKRIYVPAVGHLCLLEATTLLHSVIRSHFSQATLP